MSMSESRLQPVSDSRSAPVADMSIKVDIRNLDFYYGSSMR